MPTLREETRKAGGIEREHTLKWESYPIRVGVWGFLTSSPIWIFPLYPQTHHYYMSDVEEQEEEKKTAEAYRHVMWLIVLPICNQSLATS